MFFYVLSFCGSLGVLGGEGRVLSGASSCVCMWRGTHALLIDVHPGRSRKRRNIRYPVRHVLLAISIFSCKRGVSKSSGGETLSLHVQNLFCEKGAYFPREVVVICCVFLQHFFFFSRFFRSVSY